MSNSWKKPGAVFIVLNEYIGWNCYIHLCEDWKGDVIRGAVTAVDDWCDCDEEIANDDGADDVEKSATSFGRK